jgi:hypothetical protein
VKAVLFFTLLPTLFFTLCHYAVNASVRYLTEWALPIDDHQESGAELLVTSERWRDHSRLLEFDERNRRGK